MAEIVEFYRPQKKAKTSVPVKVVDATTPEGPSDTVDEQASVRHILTTLHQNAGPIEDILVIMRLDNGKLDFVGNLPDLEEVLVIMKDLEFKIMHFRNSDESVESPTTS